MCAIIIYIIDLYVYNITMQGFALPNFEHAPNIYI